LVALADWQIVLQRTMNLITVSNIISKFRLRVQAKCKEKKKLHLKIKNIKIVNTTIGFEHTFGDTEIPVECKDEFEDYGTLTKSFRTMFPTPGLYWLELEIEDNSNKIETKQRSLSGNIGHGWSKKNEKIKCNFLRQPILVVDSVAIYQTKLNHSIRWLTKAMLVLTFANIFLWLLFRSVLN